ncbi:MAG: UPF0365 family protein, partial [Planctomycetota bacterium]
MGIATMATANFGLLGNTAFVGAMIFIGGLVFLVFIAVFGFFALRYGKLWIQAYMSVADVSMPSLIRMHFTKVNPN